MATTESLQAWASLVEGIEAQLAEILSKCREPEQQPSRTPFQDGPLQQKLADVQNRVGSIHGCLTRAGESVKEVDAMLEQEADALKRWLALFSELDARTTATTAEGGAALSLSPPAP